MSPIKPTRNIFNGFRNGFSFNILNILVSDTQMTLKYIKDGKKLLYRLKGYVMVLRMIGAFVTAIHVKFKEYIKGNLGAPFIVGFMVLMVAATASTRTVYSSAFANNLSIIAYCSLVAGIILQLIGYLKFRKKGENTGSS